MSKFSSAHSTTSNVQSTSLSPYPYRADDDSHAYICDRAVRGGEGREKHYPAPEWDRRLLELGGRDLFNRPNFRVVWGWSVTLRDGMALRYPMNLAQWLILRRFPAAAWGSQRQWYEPRIESGEWAPSFADEFQEDFPYMGGEEIWYAFPHGVRYSPEYAEYRLLQFLNRPKLPSVDQRLRDARAEHEAKEQETWQADYDQFDAACRPFNAQPFVGYGAKSSQRPRAKAERMTPQMKQVFKRIHAGRMARLRSQGRSIVNV